MIAQFSPAAMFLCGIAAGIRGQIKIGDVAVSRGVADFSAGVAEDGEILPRPHMPNLPFVMQQMMAVFRVKADHVEERVQRFMQLPLPAPAGLEDEYAKNVAVAPAIKDCTIGSSNLLLRDKDILKHWTSLHQGVRIGEMEAGGFVTSCLGRAHPVPWLVVRGVSDFGDELKNDQFHKFASYSPAAYVRHFLESGFDARILQQDTSRRPNASAPPAGALEKLTRISNQVAADASVIVDPDRPGPTIHLSDVYVPRTVEADIRSALAGSAAKEFPAPIFIVGDAGHGKTSLLWNLLQQRQSAAPIFLIKASALALESEATGPARVTLDEMLAASAEAAADPRGPVTVLVDTVDLLIRDEASRDAFLSVVAALREQKIQLVATCRPQEFAALKAERVIVIALAEYDDGELRRAVASHVRRFYWGQDEGNANRQLAHIEASVASGRPLRDVCRNPLALRMVFTLYAPDAIPPEINLFRLYIDYWQSRVMRDVRAGLPIPAESRNLEDAAGYLALLMLREGLPQVSRATAIRVLGKLGITPDDLDGLVTRGVLTLTNDVGFEFFHQTFFEHAAAWAFRHFTSPQAAEQFTDYLRTHPHDFFVAPIYERWLLLVLSDGDGRERTKTEARVLELLEGTLNHQYLAFAVFTQSPVDLKIARPMVLKTLSTCGPEAAKRYLNLLPNRAFRRDVESLAEVGVLWDRAQWQLTYHAFDLLERLAGTFPLAVRDFLTEHDRIGKVLGEAHKELQTHGWPVLRIIDRVTPAAPAWAWQYLSRILPDAVPTAVKGEFVSYAVGLIGRHLDQFDLQKVETMFAETVAGKVRRVAVMLAMGPVWPRIWTRKNLSIDGILDEIARAPATAHPLMLAGLAEWLADHQGPDAEKAMRAFLDEADTARSWNWGALFWRRIFEIETAVTGRVQAVFQLLAQQIGRWVNAVSDPKFQILGTVLSHHPPPAAALHTIFGAAIFERPETWEKDTPLRHALVVCADAGLSGARTSLARQVEAIGNNPTEPQLSIVRKLEAAVDKSAYCRGILLTLGLRRSSQSQCLRALRAIEEAGDLATVPIAAQIASVHLCHPFVGPRGTDEDLAQLELANFVVRLGWMPSDPLTQLVEELQAMQHRRRFTLLFERLKFGAAKGHFPAAEIFDQTNHLDSSLPAEVIPKWHHALATSLVINPRFDPAVAESAYDLITERAGDSERLSLFCHLLEALAPRDPALALSLTKQYLTSDAVADLPRTASFLLGHRLHVPFSNLIHAISKTERIALLRSARYAPPALTTSLMHILLGYDAEEIAGELKDIMADEKVDQFVHAMIAKRNVLRTPAAERVAYDWIDAVFPA